MKKRCYDVNDAKYPSYGGRGIKLCARWLGGEGFVNFLADMGEKPEQTHSIDRIDNNGDYEPGNCRWASAEQQARNKRIYKNNKTGVPDVYLKGGRWQAYISIKGKRKSLGCYDTQEEAVSVRLMAETELWR